MVLDLSTSSLFYLWTVWALKKTELSATDAKNVMRRHERSVTDTKSVPLKTVLSVAVAEGLLAF